eukprot:scaffold185528_cov51-Attheya_sp.AAC.1
MAEHCFIRSHWEDFANTIFDFGFDIDIEGWAIWCIKPSCHSAPLTMAYTTFTAGRVAHLSQQNMIRDAVLLVDFIVGTGVY